MLAGDCRTVLPTLPADSVHCCVTSPPYWGLRDYGCEGQIGLEASVAEYVAELVGVFREVRRVLRPDGTLWLNLGDAYVADGRKGRAPMGMGKNAGYSAWVNKTCDDLPAKNLIGLPWRVAFALQADGWWLRSDIIWAKPNPMPESVQDRPTRSHEYVFLLAKGASYYSDADAVKEGAIADSNRGGCIKQEALVPHLGAKNSGFGERFKPNGFRNVRSVWTIATQPCAEAHFAVMPAALAERCILAGTSERGCCPACKAPWTRVVERESLAPDAACSDERKPLHGPTYSRHKVSIPGGQSLVGYASATVGWRPSCPCDAGKPVPCTVLDPFAGAGTTLLAADRLQRRGLGIELNPAYAGMAVRRVTDDAPLLAWEGTA